MPILLAPVGASEILSETATKQKILYRENGHRSLSAQAALKRAREVAYKIGVTRVGDISLMSAAGLPVFQSARPILYGHQLIGQNSGSQGKGLSAAQAEISCLMEALESFSLEPHGAQFMRGSYNRLRPAHRVIDPRIFHLRDPSIVPDLDEPLMWTEALHAQTGSVVWLPAEAVYFPFNAVDYKTRSYYTMSSNGVAAGFSYLEALTHAAYELIERDTHAKMMNQELELTHVVIDQINPALRKSLKKAHANGIDIALMTVRNKKGAQGFPFFLALVRDGETTGIGMSTGPSIELTVGRAVSEAFQSLATVYSSAREDLRRDRGKLISQSAVKSAQIKSVSLADLIKKQRVVRFTDLKVEFAALRSHVSELGYNNMFLVNLTRTGIDVPVVKVLIPGLQSALHAPSQEWVETNIFKRLQYSLS